jgi:ubiquinone/menaquinone biosynthesis C-methylase UbiE
MTKTSAVRRYWDAHPISTDSVPFERGSREMFDTIYARWQQNGTSRRKEFLASCQGKKVLEVGCGIAIDGRYLSENGIDYQAVDLSIESLKLAGEHFRYQDLPTKFTNADATRLPFADNTFDFVYSIGVLHHVPDTEAACREGARVLKPGGNLRVMLYTRHSYHYYLVTGLVYPLIWLLLHLPKGGSLARRGPTKLRDMYEICRDAGLSKKRLLDISTDTSMAGMDNFNPHSSFYSIVETKELFGGFEAFDFWKTSLKYFPLPWFRRYFESRMGGFLQMTARKSRKVG